MRRVRFLVYGLGHCPVGALSWKRGKKGVWSIGTYMKCLPVADAAEMSTGLMKRYYVGTIALILPCICSALRTSTLGLQEEEKRSAIIAGQGKTAP